MRQAEQDRTERAGTVGWKFNTIVFLLAPAANVAVIWAANDIRVHIHGID